MALPVNGNQTKDKALDALYTNTPYTQRPAAHDVQLCAYWLSLGFHARAFNTIIQYNAIENL